MDDKYIYTYYYDKQNIPVHDFFSYCLIPKRPCPERTNKTYMRLEFKIKFPLSIYLIYILD